MEEGEAFGYKRAFPVPHFLHPYPRSFVPLPSLRCVPPPFISGSRPVSCLAASLSQISSSLPAFGLGRAHFCVLGCVHPVFCFLLFS
ncbi:hypothetical protein NL676_033670 [Syzygium grande]|nr:hypothetical protein NL676_033670 [Syzygium grande]